jgi:translation elongation factor EF-G
MVYELPDPEAAAKSILSIPPDPVKVNVSETEKDKVSEAISVLEKVKVVFTFADIYLVFKVKMLFNDKYKKTTKNTHKNKGIFLAFFIISNILIRIYETQEKAPTLITIP